MCDLLLDWNSLDDLFSGTEIEGKGLVDSNFKIALPFDEHSGLADGSLKASWTALNVHCRAWLGKMGGGGGIEQV